MIYWLLAIMTVSSHPSQLQFEVERPEGYHLDVEHLLEQIERGDPVAPVRVKGHLLTSQMEGGELTDRLTVDLEPWQSGDHLLGFYTLRLHSEGRPDLTRLTGASTLHVEPFEEPGAIPDSTLFLLDGRAAPHLSRAARQAREEAMQESQRRGLERLEFRRILQKLLLALLLVALLFLGLRRVLRRLSSELPRAPSDPRAEALQALQRLVSEDLPGRGLLDPFYVRLTGIVRRYIEEAHGLRAPERTTEEFLSDALRYFGQEMGQLLRTFLSSADLVKFARSRPTLDETDAALISARTVILQDRSST